MSNARKFHAQRKESNFQIDCFHAYDIDCLSQVQGIPAKEKESNFKDIDCLLVLQGIPANEKESNSQIDCFPAYEIDCLSAL